MKKLKQFIHFIFRQIDKWGQKRVDKALKDLEEENRAKQEYSRLYKE